jgi:hypothetical protein
MWVAYNRYIMRDGWATEQMEVDLSRGGEIKSWAKSEGVVASFAYDERGVVWMTKGEDEDTALAIAEELDIPIEFILRWFEGLDLGAEYGSDERGCDEYHRLKDDGLL